MAQHAYSSLLSGQLNLHETTQTQEFFFIQYEVSNFCLVVFNSALFSPHISAQKNTNLASWPEGLEND